MECCNKKMCDWSYYNSESPKEKVPHFYCLKCGNTYHDNHKYTPEEWFFYINEVTHQNRSLVEAPDSSPKPFNKPKE